MNGWAAALLSIGLVLNPPGLSRSIGWRGTFPKWRARALSVVVGASIFLIGIGLLTSPILDSLDLSGPTFRLAAALVIGITGTRWFISPGRPNDNVATQREADIFLITTVLTPGPVLAVMASNAEAGTVAGIISVIVALAVTILFLIVPKVPEPTSGAITRFLGALALVIAIAIGIDSARTV